MSLKREYIRPKDFSFYEVTIDGNDVTDLIFVTEMFQDIFTPIWTANLYFIDTNNAIMNMPIKPGSKVEITIETKAPKELKSHAKNVKKKKFIFYVSKIGSRSIAKQDTYTYNISCISKEYFTDQKTRVSKFYKAKNPESIVQNIVSETKLGTVAELSYDAKQYDVIIPNWSPFTAINWIASFARRGNKGGSDFLFFRKGEGKFSFKSIDDMLVTKSDLKFVQKLDGLVDGDRENIRPEMFKSIGEYKFINHLDSIPNFARGYFGSKIITHDLISKSLSETKYEYGQDSYSDKLYKPFDGDVFNNASNSNITYMPFHKGVSTKGLTPNEKQFEWVGSRKSNIMKLETNRLLIDIPGDAEIFDHLGEMCEIDLPSQQDATDETLDKYLKGEYLITAVRHIITHTEYTINMELNKKRLNEAY